jgi:polar amino acid transport system permease protein
VNTWLIPVISYLATGYAVTLVVSLGCVLFATVVGALIGIASASHWPAVKLFVRLYVDFFRGIPSLLTLLFVFFALPRFGIETSPIQSSILGLGLWGSANIAETVRGALRSVPSGQFVGARALGMTWLQTFCWVILPQAIRRFLPPYVGQITLLIQASALTSVVGVTDLLGAARQMIERLSYVGGGSHAIAVYSLVMLGFFAICYPLTLLSEYLEKKSR